MFLISLNLTNNTFDHVLFFFRKKKEEEKAAYYITAVS